MLMVFLLVVVQIINQHGIAIVKGECHAPIAIHRHRMKPGQVAGKAMQSPARQVHIFWRLGNIQASQQAQQLLRVVRLDAGFAARLEEGLQPLVLETLYHAQVYSEKLQVSTGALLLHRYDIAGGALACLDLM